jgi:SnoaL-like domain
VTVDPADHIELVDLVYRFAWAADHGAWDDLAEVLCAEVTFDPGAAMNVTAEPRPAAQFLALLQGGLPYSAKEHLVGNCRVIMTEPSTAEVLAYVHVTLTLQDLATPTWTMGGTYRFSARREDRWRIAAIALTTTWEGKDTGVRAEAGRRRAAAAAG